MVLLARTVVVTNPATRRVEALAAGSELPAWAADLVTNPDALAVDADASPAGGRDVPGDTTANEGEGADASISDGDAGHAAANAASDGADSHDVGPSDAEPNPANEGGSAEESSTADAASAPTDPTAGFPGVDATIRVITDWVGGDKARARHALDAEVARGDDSRSTLVDALTAIAAGE